MTMLYWINSNLGDFQYLWVDMFHILPFAITSACVCARLCVCVCVVVHALSMCVKDGVRLLPPAVSSDNLSPITHIHTRIPQWRVHTLRASSVVSVRAPHCSQYRYLRRSWARCVCCVSCAVCCALRHVGCFLYCAINMVVCVCCVCACV